MATKSVSADQSSKPRRLFILTVVRWLQDYLSPSWHRGFLFDNTPHGTLHEQGPQTLSDDHVYTRKINSVTDTDGYIIAAAYTLNPSYAILASESGQSQDLLYPPLKPFPFKNFDLGDRQRPFEYSKPWSPILPARVVNVTPFKNDDQRDNSEENLEKAIDVPESEKDTSMIGAFTVGASQHLAEPDIIDTSMVDTLTVSAAEEVRAPTSYTEDQASAITEEAKTLAITEEVQTFAVTEEVQTPTITEEVEASKDLFVAAPTPPNNAGTINTTSNVATMARVSLVGFQQLQNATFSSLHPVDNLLATPHPQHGSRSGFEDLLLPPSPKQLLKISLNDLGVKKAGLLFAVEEFFRSVRGSRIYEDAVAAILDWLQDAEEDLKPHIQHAQFTDLIKCHSWFRALHHLDEYLQHQTNFYATEGASDLVDFAKKIAEFGDRLQPSVPACIIAQPPVFSTIPQKPPVNMEPMKGLQMAGSTVAPPYDFAFGTSSVDFAVPKNDFLSARQGRTMTRRPGESRQRVKRTSLSRISCTIHGVGKPSPTGSPL